MLMEKVIDMINGRNAVVFLSGLACFFLALNGQNEWAGSFGTVAILVLIFG